MNPPPNAPLVLTLDADRIALLGAFCSALRLPGEGVDAQVRAVLDYCLRRPTRWRCDGCDHWIETARDGAMQWIWNEYGGYARGLCLAHTPETRPRRGSGGLRLVREGEDQPEETLGCGDGPQVAGDRVLRVPIAHLLDHDGPTQLLAWMEEGKLPGDELRRMFLRLHVPDYDDALPFVRDAQARGIFTNNLPAGFYWAGDLVETLRALRAGRLADPSDGHPRR